MTARVAATTLVVVAFLVSGCSSSTPHNVAATSPTSVPATKGGPMDANMDMGAANHPSGPASMICRPEIQHAVQRTLALPQLPAARSHWSSPDRAYTCTYGLPGGRLVLSVQDALRVPAGRAHFARVRRGLSGAHPIRGVENFGFPAVTSARGEVAFLKDGKTLLVDATGVSSRSLPRKYTREDVAYALASAVIACWSE
jgi:hypothetical protein